MCSVSGCSRQADQPTTVVNCFQYAEPCNPPNEWYQVGGKCQTCREVRESFSRALVKQMEEEQRREDERKTKEGDHTDKQEEEQDTTEGTASSTAAG